MAKNETIFFTKDGHIAQAVGFTTIVDVFTAGADGAKIFSIYTPIAVTGSLSLYIKESGGTDVDIFNIENPANTVNLLANQDILPKDAKTNPYINIPAGAKLRASANAAMTVRVYYEDY
tara:strand:- start:240 stop:596 length:357 start_codon:yes stop_codon:yes gene_type:complete